LPYSSLNLHDTRTASLAFVQCVIPANKLSLQELNQLIEIKLLPSGSLKIFDSCSKFLGVQTWVAEPFSSGGEHKCTSKTIEIFCGLNGPL